MHAFACGPEMNYLIVNQLRRKRIMREGSSNTREISLGENFGDVAVQVKGIRLETHADGSVDVYTNGPVKVHPAANDDGKPKASPEIGAIESTGEHKGEIYGGILPSDNKPIWFSAAPKLMDHYKAAAWAEGQGGSLPTRKQGDYLTTLKGKGGAFTEIFNRGSSFPAGYVWLAEPFTFGRYGAWCQRLSDGDQDYNIRNSELPVLSVRR
jgi:hypothetical protein